MLELATLIWRHARYRGDAVAVVFGDERLTYAQFGARVARSANLLRSLGIGKGDKVATVLANSREALELVWAVPAVGAALVPLSPLLMPAGLASLLRDVIHDRNDNPLIVPVVNLITSYPVLPAVKALVAHLHGDDAYARMRPPLVDLSAPERSALTRSYEALLAPGQDRRRA